MANVLSVVDSTNTINGLIIQNSPKKYHEMLGMMDEEQKNLKSGLINELNCLSFSSLVKTSLDMNFYVNKPS